MITPTVGRIVWFCPPLKEGDTPPEQPYGAMIAYVHNDRLVTLSVVDHKGMQFPARNVPLVQDGEEPKPGGFFCTWMPYQKGQAARTEQLERAQQQAGPTTPPPNPPAGGQAQPSGEGRAERAPDAQS